MCSVNRLASGRSQAMKATLPARRSSLAMTGLAFLRRHWSRAFANSGRSARLPELHLGDFVQQGLREGLDIRWGTSVSACVSLRGRAGWIGPAGPVGLAAGPWVVGVPRAARRSTKRPHPMIEMSNSQRELPSPSAASSALGGRRPPPGWTAPDGWRPGIVWRHGRRETAGRLGRPRRASPWRPDAGGEGDQAVGGGVVQPRERGSAGPALTPA